MNFFLKNSQLPVLPHERPAAGRRRAIDLWREAAIICLLCSLAGTATATTWQDPAAVLDSVKAHIHQELGKDYDLQIKLGYLDERLRLANCGHTPEAFFPPRQHTLGPTTVGVRCHQPKWDVYVPVEIRAYSQVAVAKHGLAKDTVLTAADIELSRREVSGYRRGIYEDTQALVGMVVKRPLAAGAVLTPRNVAPKRLVQRGEAVTILAQHGNMLIRVQGEALMDGHRGEIIRVQNSRSGQTLSAEVIDTLTVRVKM